MAKQVQHPASPKPNNSNKTLIIVICAVVGLFVLSAIVGAIFLFFVGKKVSDKSNEFVEQAQELQESVSTYPSSYVSANLPQYPDATVTNLSGKEGNPKEGVVLYMLTRDQVTDVATYFDQHMQDQGWQIDTSTSSSQDSSSVVTRVYKKDNQQLTMTAGNSDEGTNITISWEEQS